MVNKKEELAELKSQLANIQARVDKLEKEDNSVFNYPMWFESLHFPGFVVKFTGLQEGIVVKAVAAYDVGDSIVWTPHTRTLAWSQIEEPITPEIEQWEPLGGEYYVDSEGWVREDRSDYDYRMFGVEYPTKPEAEWATKQMRSFNRLLCYITEHTDGVPKDIEFYVDSYGVFRVSHKLINPIASSLSNKIKSGEVVL